MAEQGKKPTNIEAFQVAMYCIARGIPCPQPFAELITRNWWRFVQYECASLGEAFGIPDHKHPVARKNELNTEFMFQLVKEFQKDGHPLRDSAEGKGALSIAADFFCVSPSTVEARMTAHRKERKAAGGDADAEWRPTRELARELKGKASAVEHRLLLEEAGKAALHIARITQPKKSRKS